MMSPMKKIVIGLSTLCFAALITGVASSYAYFSHVTAVPSTTVTAAGSRYLYVDCNSKWNPADSSHIWLYYFNSSNSTNEWVAPSLSPSSGVYAFAAKSATDYPGVIFVQTTNASSGWGGNVAYQTSDLSNPTNNQVKYTIATAGSGSGTKATGSWGVYS